jgi:hypothetical protein
MPYYHGSAKPLKKGTVLKPGMGMGLQSYGFMASIEQAFERKRPAGVVPRISCVFMCDNPEGVRRSGGSSQYIYEVQPIGRVDKSDQAWYGSYNLPSVGPERAINNYWQGTQYPNPAESLWEYRAKSAKVVRLVSQGEKYAMKNATGKVYDYRPTREEAEKKLLRILYWDHALQKKRKLQNPTLKTIADKTQPRYEWNLPSNIETPNWYTKLYWGVFEDGQYVGRIGKRSDGRLEFWPYGGLGEHTKVVDEPDPSADKPLPPVESSFGKSANQYIDEEWREILTSFNWKPYASTETSQRWFHPNSTIQVSIEYPKDDYPYFVVWDRETKKELVQGRDTKSLMAYAEPEEEPIQRGREPSGAEDEDFLKDMKIKWSGTLLGSCSKPVMSALNDVNDLDEYDSQIAYDLMALHDEIIDAPIRGVVPDYRESYRARALYNFTFNALKNRLLPAIVKALKRLQPEARAKAMRKVEAAIENFNLSQQTLDTMGLHNGRAGMILENAFMRLHEAIETIRDATREE